MQQVMYDMLKSIIFKSFDLLTYPVTLVSGLQMWLLRRGGIPNFPLSRKFILSLGVFPIRRHFYEPQFHPDDLDAAFASQRHLPGIDLQPGLQLDFLSQFKFGAELQNFLDPKNPILNNGKTFNMDNVAFGPGDIDFYYSIIRLKKPERIIEIGSGNSTIVALAAIEQNAREDSSYKCEFISVEPYPWFEHPAIKHMKEKVENVALDIFQALEKDDILFIDSSHMIRPQGDVVYEYLNILPCVGAGGYIHIHDIFTPFNYPEVWVKSWHLFWNEQYMVEALLSETHAYKIIGALHYLSRLFPEQAKAAMPLLKDGDKYGQSLWLLKAGSAMRSPETLHAGVPGGSGAC
jgi:hypothetical protein